MKLIGLMPCRNEDWCLGLTARAALMWVDELIVSNHHSEDRTRDILSDVSRESGNRLTEIEWRDVEWTEMAQRQQLLEVAREHEATHVAMIDADEILTGNLLKSAGSPDYSPLVRDQVMDCSQGRILQIPWIQLKRDTQHCMSTGMWAEQDVSIAFRDSLDYHWQSAAGEEHFHHRHPKGRPLIPWRPLNPAGPRGGGLMHLQFLSERRLKAKQCLYQLHERLRWPERKPADYARTVREAESANIAECPDSWWAPYRDLMRYLDVDAEPWQQKECERLVAEHGRAKFSDLDLFGVV